MGMINFSSGPLTNKLQNLREGLKRFGLDPRDWELNEAANGMLVIQHVGDPKLLMLGQAFTQGHSWDWQEISLAAV